MRKMNTFHEFKSKCIIHHIKHQYLRIPNIQIFTHTHTHAREQRNEFLPCHDIEYIDIYYMTVQRDRRLFKHKV